MPVSDKTTLIIDEEVTEIINSCYARAKQLLTDNRDILEAMKDALLKYETIDANQIDDLMNRRPVRPPELSGGSSSQDSNKDNGAGGDKPADSKHAEAPKADAQPSEVAQANTPAEPQSEPKAEAKPSEAPSSEPSAPAETKPAEPSQPASSGWPYNTPSGKRDDNK